MKKLLVCMFLAFGVATPLAVADTGSAIVTTDTGSAAAAPTDPAQTATPTPASSGSDAASKLHDPVNDLNATIGDLKAAKKTGWGLALFAGLVILFRLVGRAKSLPFVGSRLAFLGQGKAAAYLAAGSAAAIAGFDALAGGASWFALFGVIVGAILHHTDATPAPKPAT